MAQFPSTSSASDVWSLIDQREAQMGSNFPTLITAPSTVEYLVIAGGGAGGGGNNLGEGSAGGGAGGYRTNTGFSVSGGSSYTVTVGAGGTGTTGGNVTGGKGSDSAFASITPSSNIQLPPEDRLPVTSVDALTFTLFTPFTSSEDLKILFPSETDAPVAFVKLTLSLNEISPSPAKTRNLESTEPLEGVKKPLRDVDDEPPGGTSM